MTRFFPRIIPHAGLAIVLLASPAVLNAKPEREIPLAICLTGGLDFTPAANGRIQIKADMTGIARFFGISKAEAVWLAPQAVITDLESGVIQEANIGAGTLTAVTANKSTVTGSFNGRLVRLPSGLIGFESSFVVSGGTGHLENTSGSGIMTGSANPETLSFDLLVSGSVTLQKR